MTGTENVFAAGQDDLIFSIIKPVGEKRPTLWAIRNRKTLLSKFLYELEVSIRNACVSTGDIARICPQTTLNRETGGQLYDLLRFAVCRPI